MKRDETVLLGHSTKFYYKVSTFLLLLSITFEAHLALIFKFSFFLAAVHSSMTDHTFS